MLFVVLGLLLLLLALFPLGTLLARTCADELVKAEQPTTFLLTASLLIATAILLYGQVLWVQLSVVALLFLLTLKLSPGLLLRLFLAPLALLVTLSTQWQALTGAALLILGVLALSVLEARCLPKKTKWKGALVVGLRAAALPAGIGVGIVVVLLIV